MLPIPEDGTPQDCVSVLQQQSSPHPDLRDMTLDNSDLVLFVDGSAFRDPARRKIGLVLLYALHTTFLNLFHYHLVTIMAWLLLLWLLSLR